MGEYRYRENVKRGMAFVLAIILGGMAFLPGFPVFPAKAAPASGQQTTLTTAHGDTLLGHKLYCIDKGGYAIWGIAEKGDLYEAHRPSQASVPLSSQEQKYVFGRCSRSEQRWGMKRQIHLSGRSMWQQKHRENRKLSRWCPRKI